jgi:hypothetical protein
MPRFDEATLAISLAKACPKLGADSAPSRATSRFWTLWARRCPPANWVVEVIVGNEMWACLPGTTPFAGPAGT